MDGYYVRFAWYTCNESHDFKDTCNVSQGSYVIYLHFPSEAERVMLSLSGISMGSMHYFVSCLEEKGIWKVIYRKWIDYKAVTVDHVFFYHSKDEAPPGQILELSGKWYFMTETFRYMSILPINVLSPVYCYVICGVVLHF